MKMFLHETKKRTSTMQVMTFANAISEGMRAAMNRDEKVLCYGLGVTDPKGIFGTTIGL